MSIDKKLTSQAVKALGSLDSVQMDMDALADDVVHLSFAFPRESDYMAAVVNTVKALKDLVRGTVSPSALSGTFTGWESYHYQPKVGQGIPADMRIVFKRELEGIRVLGFGHRYIPIDLYRRMSALLPRWSD